MVFFFFNDTATTEIYTLSLHDALPISIENGMQIWDNAADNGGTPLPLKVDSERLGMRVALSRDASTTRSEEHTSEIQSRQYLVCRLLLEKKKNTQQAIHILT